MQELTEAIREIRDLCHRSIAADDFNYDDNNELTKYCSVLEENSNLTTWIPQLFELLEEFDETVDLTLGSPGPIVHTFEATSPIYEEFLMASLTRKPTGTAVWMAQRISRTPGKDEIFWLAKLKDVLKHPQVSEDVIEMLENG